MGAPVLTLAPTEPAEPKKPRRARGGSKHWPPSPANEAAIRRVLGKLADARTDAGWEPNRLKPSTPLCRRRHGALALKLWELQRDGEPDPERLLVAVLQAKVDQQRRRKDDHGTGLYAHAKSIFAGDYWDSNVTAGRAWLASGGRPAATTSSSKRGGAFVPRGEYTEL